MEREILMVMMMIVIGFGVIVYLLAFRIDELNREIRLLKMDVEYLRKALVTRNE